MSLGRAVLELSTANGAVFFSDLEKAKAGARDMGKSWQSSSRQIEGGAKSSQQSLRALFTEVGSLDKRLSLMAVSAGAAIGTMATALLQQGVSSLVAFGREAFTSAGQIVDLRNKTGLSTATIQRMQYVADQTGTSLDAMTDSAFKLGIRLNGGSASVRSAAEALRLEWDKLQKMRPDEQFETVVEALSKVENAQQRNRIGTELFGKSFAGIAAVVKEGYEDIAKAANVSTDAQLESLDRAGDAWDAWVRNRKANARSFVGELILQTQAMAEIRKAAEGQMTQQPANRRIAQLLDMQRRVQLGLVGMRGRDIELPAVGPAAASADTYVNKLATVRAELARLTADQRKEIAAAQQLGVSTDDLEHQFILSEGSLQLLGTETRSYAKSLNTLDTLTARLSGAPLVKTANEWITAIQSIGGIGRLTHAELTAFGQDVTVAVEKMRLMGQEVPSTWTAIANGVNTSGVLEATRAQLGASLKEFQQYRTQLLIQTRNPIPAQAIGTDWPAVVDQGQNAAAISNQAKDVRDAFGLMGQQTRSELQHTAHAAQAAYTTMLASGQATPIALQSAWAQYEAARRAAMGQSTRAFQQQGDALLTGAENVFGALGAKYKAAAIAGAIIATYSAISKALASAPWPFNLVLAAGAAAVGWANVAHIKKAKEGFKEGTPGLDYRDFGPRRVVELHGEEAVIPRGRGHDLADEIAAALRTRLTGPDRRQERVPLSAAWSRPEFAREGRLAAGSSLAPLDQRVSEMLARTFERTYASRPMPSLVSTAMQAFRAPVPQIVAPLRPRSELVMPLDHMKQPGAADARPIVHNHIDARLTIQGVMDAGTVAEVHRKHLIRLQKDALLFNTDGLTSATERALRK